MSSRRLAVRELMQLSYVLLHPQHQSAFSGIGCIPQFRSLATAAEDILVAETRPLAGSRPAARHRKSGRVPGTLFSLPGENSILLTFDHTQISTRLSKIGRTGWACHLFDVQVKTEQNGDEDGGITTYPALGRQVHMNAATDEIENVTLMYCPPDRQVRVQVPLRMFGEEVSPGLKAGGRINWISRTIPCIARGDAVPHAFEVNISALEINDKMYFSDLTLPEGVALAVNDSSLPIIKIMKK